MSSTADIKHEIHNANLVPITELRIGERGDVVDVVQINTKGLMRQRLMEMGLTTGVEVKFLRRGALGDPKSYLIRGTMIAGINLMLFSLLHNPCSTTIVTIWKETRSVKWTTLATFIPLSLAFLITFIVYQLSRLI